MVGKVGKRGWGVLRVDDGLWGIGGFGLGVGGVVGWWEVVGEVVGLYRRCTGGERGVFGGWQGG